MNTLEDIEHEVANNLMVRVMMKKTIRDLKNAEEKMGVNGADILKAMILNKRPLTDDEFAEVGKRFGSQGIVGVDMIARLGKGQKQYIFKRMGWNINEVE